MEICDNTLISIIIPVYNSQTYLKDCFNSILAQTYEDYEVIIVDDGSTDDSYKICDWYANKYDKFSVIHSTNHGLACARNMGMDKANGNYFTFLDSDDMIATNFLERLLKVALKYKADWVQCCMQFGSDRKMAMTKEGQEKWFRGKQALLNDCIKVTACGVLYRMSAFKAIRFPNRRIYEDEAVYYQFVYMSNTAVKIDDKLYYYFFNPNSISKVSSDYIDDSMISVYKERIAFFSEKNDKKMVLKSKEHFCRALMVLYVRCKKNKNNQNDTKSYINIIRELTREIIFTSIPSVKSKFQCALISVFPRLVTVISIKLKLNSRF